MNLDGCTPGQRQSIERVDGPLLVSAGAGSGKTFTLTQRIAYALLPESGPAANGIDEVLAITFTEKAAAEIKARVKRTLRAEGLSEEALRVDAAWISTIHGMCARILRAHALDLGIDPAFGIMGDAERADAIADAIDGALGADNDIISRGSYAALFDEYPARSSLPAAPSVASMLQALLDKAVGLRGGLDAVDFGPEPARASSIARDLLLAYEEVQPALEQAGSSATAERARAQASDAAEALCAFIDERGGRPGQARAEADAGRPEPADDDLRALARTVDGCERIGGTFKATVKPAVKAFQAAYAKAAQQIALGLARPVAEELLALAREAAARYDEAKRAACKLDNDDLLVRTLAAFEEHPDIARRYEGRFKLVMVDEFQDTSQLQVDMIARLAGEGLAHLCTVGDAQQSIYRFRGADVNVYEAHKRAMRAPETGALYVELTKNFRSHADVLSFVDRVFQQPAVFGESFMSLEPNADRPTRYRGRSPRIDLVLAMQPAGRGTGVTAADAKRACARAVARRFSALRDDGHAPGDMVVLLGRMSRAGMYAEALREEGFECVVAGGSQFASAPEVRVVARLLEAIANPANTAALFEVLTSDMVRLSADDFLELATEEDPETGRLRRRDLDKGFARLAGRADALPPRLAHAVRLFERAQSDARTRPAAAVVRDAVVRSGWMARLEREGAAGMARAANVLKAVRLIEGIESERHLGLASTARAFADELAAGCKEAPGALSGASGDVVKIMTIHASKGLEFPIVALADFADVSAPRGKLVVEACGPVARASLAPGATMDGFPQLAKRAAGPVAEDGGEDADLAAARRCIAGEDPSPTCSQAAYRAALVQRAADEELAEARRKLYVGLTRASEALVVAMDAKAPSAGKLPAYPALVDDIRSALAGTGDFPEGTAALEYGGSEPARFERILVQAGGRAAACGEGDREAERRPSPAEDGPAENGDFQRPDAEFFVPFVQEARAPRAAWSASRSEVFSYSSIAPDHDGTCGFSAPPRGLAPAALDGDPLAEGDGAGSGAADADRATDLGSAFHRAAQYEAETGKVPDAARLEALCRTFCLGPDAAARLASACGRWFGSGTCAETRAWELRRAEVPFFVPVGEAFMEGEIDLLCTRPGGAGALVVDYKTGGSDDEPLERLQKKHLLQAQCYAYALLSQGFASVELRFVRVERGDGAGQPQEVRYRFSQGDVERLELLILAARAKTM